MVAEDKARSALAGASAPAAGNPAAVWRYGQSVVFFGRLVLKFRRHSPQPACDRKIEGGSRHRNQYFSLPTEIWTTDH
jgi:hypothetical protein